MKLSLGSGQYKINGKSLVTEFLGIPQLPFMSLCALWDLNFVHNELPLLPINE